MDLIELARQFGEEIQNDEKYINMKLAEQRLEVNDQFQAVMSLFNQYKTEMNLEMAKEESDSEKIKDLNDKIEKKYDEIINNPDMISYQKAQSEFMDIIKRVNAIITRSAQGENPFTVDYEECGGSCSSCSGCQ